MAVRYQYEIRFLLIIHVLIRILLIFLHRTIKDNLKIYAIGDLNEEDKK